jgi:hypothetical protein
VSEVSTWDVSSDADRCAEPPADPQCLQPDPGSLAGRAGARLDPLNRGQADPAALEVLRQTGTRQVVVVVVVVVIDEPRVFAPGQWQATVDRLVASGRFRISPATAPWPCSS